MKTILIISYIAIILITYIYQRYTVISGKRDDPFIISLLIAVFWPALLLVYLIYLFIISIESLLTKVYIIKNMIHNKELDMNKL